MGSAGGANMNKTAALLSLAGGALIYRIIGPSIIWAIYDLTEPDWDELRRHRE